nr:MAG TPA: hypothetical protein [Caudoviricetes sp.]
MNTCVMITSSNKNNQTKGRTLWKQRTTEPRTKWPTTSQSSQTLLKPKQQ